MVFRGWPKRGAHGLGESRNGGRFAQGLKGVFHVLWGRAERVFENASFYRMKC